MVRTTLMLGPLLAWLAASAGCGGRDDTTTAAKRHGVLEPDKKVTTQNNLRKLGRAYRDAHEKTWVSGPKDLGPDVQNSLKSTRDNQPFEVVWNFKRLSAPIPLGTKVLLAWERTADSEGGRYVLQADFTTVEYMREADFQNTVKAKPNR
jgi:hypothetical protein